jgi:hypothetical protein
MLPSSHASVPSRTPSPHVVIAKRMSKVWAAEGLTVDGSTATKTVWAVLAVKLAAVVSAPAPTQLVRPQAPDWMKM